MHRFIHTSKIKGMQVEEFFEPMITSKEPDHSLRGYSHREDGNYRLLMEEVNYRLRIGENY
jgi:hypothetical protein